MIELSDEDRKEVLGEILMDELRIIRELVRDVPLIKQKVIDLEDDMFEVKSDIKAMKAAIKDQSNVLQNHEGRITRLARKEKTSVT